jgi:pyruvate-formate lyase-activating enzyme
MTIPHNNICPLPWISVKTTTLGMMRPCCISEGYIADASNVPANLADMDITSAYKSKSMQNLRQQFRAGLRPANCKNCWTEEDAGRTSKRQHSLERFRDQLDGIDWNNDAPDQLWYLDLELGNLCNLKCRICGKTNSSRWVQEELDQEPPPPNNIKRSSPTYKLLKMGEWAKDNQNFWEDLRRIMSSATDMEFAGGEPFMQTDHVQLLELAVEMNRARDIRLHYNTNGTLWPDLEHLWQHFREVEISFSVDNLNQRFEYERYGASWNRFTENLARFRDMATRLPNIKLAVCTTINVQNIYYLHDILTWITMQNFDAVYLNMLHTPDHMSIAAMTEAAKDLVLPTLEPELHLLQYRDNVLSMRRLIETGATSDGSTFRDYMSRTDAYRMESFRALYPEMARAMGYDD